MIASTRTFAGGSLNYLGSARVDSGDRVVALPLSPDADEQLAQPAALTGSAALIWEWLEEPVTLTQLATDGTPRVSRMKTM